MILQLLLLFAVPLSSFPVFPVQRSELQSMLGSMGRLDNIRCLLAANRRSKNIVKRFSLLCHKTGDKTTVRPPSRQAPKKVDDIDLSFDPFDHTDLAYTEFAEQCARTFNSHGWVHVPNYLTAEETEILRQEAQSLLQQGRSFYSTDSHTVFQEEPNPSLPNNHPRNMLQQSSKHIIDFSDCGQASELSRIYHRRSLHELVRICTSLPQLFLSACPYNAAYYNFYGIGDGLAWHFDRSHFGVNLILQRAGAGGEFEFHHGTRAAAAAAAGDEAVCRSVESIVNSGGGSGVAVGAALRPGSLVVFAGRDSLHRVSPVTAGPARANAILTYESAPGQRIGAYSLAKFFGRGADGRRLPRPGSAEIRRE